MRQPSIHVTKECLEELFQDFGIKVDIMKFMLAAKQYALTSRRVIVPKNKAQQVKLEKLTKSDDNVCDFLAIYIRDYFIENKLRSNYPIITRTSSDWSVIESIGKQIVEFANQFNLEHITAVKIYVDIAYKLTGKSFSIHKFSYYRTRIISYYEMLYAIENDPNQEMTVNMMNHYLRRVNELSTVKLADLKVMSVYYHFVLASDNAIKKRAPYKDWIDAQFEAIAFAKAIPEPKQLYGMLAENNYRKFQMKNNKR